MSKFCPLPWVGLHVSPSGNYTPCCKYTIPIAKDLKSYLSSEHLATLNDEFNRGELPNGCKQCWDEEDAGVLSKRKYDIDYVLNGDLENLDEYKILSLTFGNICNLSCRTCGSYASSGWIRDEKKLNKKIIFGSTKIYKDPSFFPDIKAITKNLTYLTFAGGEVFYSGFRQHLDYLDFLIENSSENITLDYITNGTIFPAKELWERWKKFKKVGIMLSIDGTEERFEYLRYPANWNQCYQNIKQYQQMGDKISLSISHTVSFFNVYYLDEFYFWCLQEKLPVPLFNMVHYPEEFNIKYIPKDIKNKIYDKLSKFKVFQPVTEFMQESKCLDLDVIMQKIYEVDTLRNQNFHNTFKEFSLLLNEFCK